MKISKKEYDREIAFLKSCKVTDEELDGLLEFFEYTIEIEPNRKRTRVLNSRKTGESK